MQKPGINWNPQTDDELRRAADNGLLEETHHLDLKREVSKGDSANRNLAKDIAAFAIDGGAILVGIDEDASPPSLYPTDISGLAERAEQIARMKIDEGVAISTTAIPASSNPDLGYMVINVPPSPRAPHMVDGRYYGRGDKTNRQLSNAEVLRLHQQRIAEQDDIIAKTHQALRDEIPDAVAESDVMMLLAEPLGAIGEFLVPLTEAKDWQQTLLRLVQSAAIIENQQFAPTLARPSQFFRRAGGVSCATGMYGTERFQGGATAVELVFNESGRLTLTSERTVISPDPNQVGVFEVMIIGHTDLLVRLIPQLATEFGFAGSWRLALVISGLKGATSYTMLTQGGWPSRAQRYTNPYYERATTASLFDLEQSPLKIVRELIFPLLRSLGSHEIWRPHLTDQGQDGSEKATSTIA